MTHPKNDFLITDPLGQQDVVTEVPEGVERIDLDDVPYRAEPQVHCAFCKQRQLHNDGYFAVLSNGQRAPCGNCCAANFDAVKKRTIDRTRLRLKRERDDRERAESLTQNLDELSAIAESTDRALGEIALVTTILREVFSDGACNDLRMRGIRGLEILNGCDTNPDNSRVIFVSIKRRVNYGATKKNYANLVEERQSAVAELIKAVEHVNSCKDFFEPRNIAAIENWVATTGTKYGVHQFKLKNGRIHPKGPGHWQNFDVPALAVPTAAEVHNLASG